MPVSKCKHGIYLDGCKECFPVPEITGEDTITLKELRRTELYADVRRGLTQHAQDVLELVMQKVAYQQENQSLKERIAYLESQVYGGTTK
jgi:hypothetical protein